MGSNKNAEAEALAEAPSVFTALDRLAALVSRRTGVSACFVSTVQAGGNPNPAAAGRNPPPRESGAYTALPLFSALGDRLGYLCLIGARQDTDAEERIALERDLADFSAIAATLLEQHHANANRRLDPLTGLPGRIDFQERCQPILESLTEPRATASIIFLDVKRFCSINDAYGVAAGDLVLREFGRRLAQLFNGRGIIGRVGDDEFAVLLPGTGTEDAAHALEEVRHQAAEPSILYGEQRIHSGFTCGVSIYPQDGGRMEDLIRRAELAVADAERLGQFSAFYERGTVTGKRREFDLEVALRETLRSGGLQLHYQLVLCLATGRICEMEALARWHHPKFGDVPPDLFIQVAEQVGLIAALDRQILRQALKETAGGGLPVAVNLSADSFHDPKLPEVVREALEESGRKPEALILEITERLLTDPKRAGKILGDLRNLGVRVAVDDFGTGYSALGILPELPVHRLKVDKQFLIGRQEDPTYDAIIRSSIALAHGIGVEILVEGVERTEDLEWLGEQECDLAQGFLIHRPVPLSEISVDERQC